MNKLGMFATGCLAGLVFTVAATKTPVRTLSISALASATTSFIACLIVDTRKQAKLNDAEERANTNLSKLQRAEGDFNKSQETISGLNTEISKMKELLTIAKKGLENYESDSEKSRLQIADLVETVNTLGGELHACKQELNEKRTSLEEIEEHFDAIVHEEAQKIVKRYEKTRIQEVFNEHDEITSEAMRLFKQLQGWGQKVRERHETLKESAKELRRQYAKHIDEYTEKVTKEREALLHQIEVLNERIALLQHQLNGDLVKPQYGQFGYAVEGKIANDIARRFWEELQIPLAVKGYQVKHDGSVDVGYGFSRSVPVEALVADLNRHSGGIAKALGIHKIASIRKLEISDLLVLTFRREPALKESEIGQLVGTAQEFIRYVTSNQIRYRLIADPHSGKTPTTAVMLSAILKAGTRQANTEKGAKVPHTLVAVAYPGRESSLKDERYPLDLFLKYATESSAVKSFGDAVEDWKYRKTHTTYAKQFFQLWCWDEFDNTITSASDPKGVAEDIKQLLKQAHHTNQGWIFSGQSVMTSQIPGFTNDDRSLFIEIVIGIPKIRKYLETYGKQRNSDETLNKLRKSLDAIQDYVEHQNEKITDEARQLRVALVMDSRSPKLFFLPSLDDVDFDVDVIKNSESLAEKMKSGLGVHPSPVGSSSPDSEKCNVDGVGIAAIPSGRPKSTIPHCPECGSPNVSQLKDNRYRCKDCGVKRAVSKVVWK